MKSIFKTLSVTLILLVATSCELDLLDNPNEVSPSQASPDFIVNNIQVTFPRFFKRISEFGMDNTRMTAMFGNTYPNAYQAVNFNTVWDMSYSDILNDSKLILNQYAENDNLDYHAGMAYFFQAYTLMTLVDYFGDVPFSEALDPDNFNPNTDSGSEVYAAALVSLNAAITAFGAVDNATDLPENDLYYGGDAALWLTACNTLKLRYYLQTRLVNNAESVAQINTLIAANDLIDTNEEAFVFNYSSASISAPDARHEWFSENYITGASQYMSNSYMNEMYIGHGGEIDPRIRYYFYRQIDATPTDVNVLDCINQSKPAHYGVNDVFCAVGEGYFGRDHLDDDGIPPDGLVRTIYGLYPAGGQFDDDEAVPGTPQSGALGAGIAPILMPAFTYFMLAEAASEIGTTGDPRALLEQGINSSIDYVTTFNAGFISEESTNIPSQTAIDDYVASTMTDYDAATDKLDFIVRQYWVALWGNGLDMYNTYRRTLKPVDLQPTLNATPGEFYRSFTYPADFVTLNSSPTSEQKASPAVQVFWDTNPTGAID